MRCLVFFIALFLGTLGYSQAIQTDQRLISTQGSKFVSSSSYEYSFSIGEPVIHRGSINNKSYTQGFQQPNGRITFTVIKEDVSCTGGRDGSLTIIDIQGCSEPYNVSINGIVQSDLNLQGLSAGTYLIVVYNATCSTEKEIILNESSDVCSLKFYNGFTPNNDGTNDVWLIENITIPPFEKNSIAIYNRWGSVVWEGQNYDNESVSFAGKDSKENDLPDGTYFYVAKINSEEYSGYIQIMR
ncbi:MAG: gliding motility-associated C-terminal domain-containing protein [Flavobacteriales bacterium]|nr:gliding motility-associated C-terminal domain-containing protein [Flavobacteriales bacterium]